jgi:hypothetical protein
MAESVPRVVVAMVERAVAVECLVVEAMEAAARAVDVMVGVGLVAETAGGWAGAARGRQQRNQPRP